ncbi:Fic family protein [Candidatus Dojkabacteria bacterium]|uniref:Fic family protein n=1 Tax=Candidatus Dojkabacteria bacterium TaxID=2099670 RepID=A0A952AHR1_9BACT|nr:Fic family protein [Candidatus Dojkabacteria bacterium]
MAYQPQYTISNYLLNRVASAEAAKEVIANALLVPSYERQFRHRALARTIHHSIAIEGNALSLSETEEVIAGRSPVTIRQRDIREIINYRNAIAYIEDKRNQTMSLDFILGLHKVMGEGVLPKEKVGVVRTTDSVIISSKTGEVVFDPPKAVDLDYELQELFNWDNNQGTTVHPLLRAGILHFELVRIHPFVDLNGRTSRILATWSLFRDNYDIRRFFSLEEYYDQNSLDYYKALDSAHDGDLTEWLEYFATGVAVELGRIKTQVLELSRDQKLIQKLGQVALNERQVKIIRYIEDNGEFRNTNFSQLFAKISDDTILRDLKDLIDKRILVKKGKTRAAKYLLA